MSRILHMMRALTVCFVIVGSSGCSTVRSAKLFAPTCFGFTEVGEDVYVNDEMPAAQRQEFLKTLSRAKDRVSAFFGDLEGTPRIFACSTEECFVSHGGTAEKGKAYGSAALLLSPRGLNEVIASHELTHIELHNRVGAFRAWRSIPPWFDEGLAVLVSEDPRYSEEEWLRATDNGRTAPKLDEIGRLLGKGPWLLSYGTARREVAAWYARAGCAGLKRLIDAVKNGDDFTSALNAISANAAANSTYK